MTGWDAAWLVLRSFVAAIGVGVGLMLTIWALARVGALIGRR